MAKVKDDNKPSVTEKSAASPLSPAPAAPINQLALAKQQVAEAMGETKRAFRTKFEALVDFLKGLDADEINEIITDTALKPSLRAINLQVAYEAAEPTKRARKAPGAKRKRSANKPDPTAEQILAFIGAKGLKTSELVAEFGSKVKPKLEELVKAHKLTTTIHQGRGKPSTVYQKA
jgi:phosphoserine phosphatase